MSPAKDSLVIRTRALWLGALGVLVYVLWLGLRDFWYPGEPDLAEICRAMFESGDWTVPRRNGEIFLNYGPFFYWAGSTASHLLGGISEFAFRLPGALAATVLVVATCLAGSRWFGARAGMWAGLLLLTSWQFTWQAVGFRPDMLFSLFVGLGVLVYALGAGETPRWAPRIAGFALLGVAVLVKGPLGLLLPGLVLTLWHGARREWKRIFEMGVLSLVAAAVAVPWYLATARALGTETMLSEFYGQNFGRFASGERGHDRPFYYYLTRIWIDLGPWALLLPFALWWMHRARVWRDRHVQLALWWFGAFLVFLTLSATKRQLYLIPAYPAATLLLSRWLAALPGGRQETPADPRPARIFAAAFTVLIAVLPVIALAAAAALDAIVERLDDLDAASREAILGLRAPLIGIGAVLGALAIWAFRGRRAGLPVTLRRLAMAQVALYVMVVAWVFPTVNPVNTYAPEGRWLAENMGSSERLGFIGSDRKIGAFGYHTGAIVVSLQTEDEIDSFFREYPDSLLVVYEERVKKLEKSERTDWMARKVREFTAARQRYFVFRGS